MSSWSRRRGPELPRLPQSSDDPVGDVLAAAEAVSRVPDEILTPDDLRELVQVHAGDPGRWLGLNTEIWFADDCGSYADLFDDGLEQALAEQPGIDEADQTDREVVRVRSRLSLPDVHAAAIRSLLDVNRRPRHTPRAPDLLDDDRLRTLAAAVGPMLAGHGFSGALHLVGESGQPLGEHGFYRIRTQRLVQQVTLWKGMGELADGTQLDGKLTVTAWLVEPDSPDPAELTWTVRGREFVRGITIDQERRDGIRPTAPALERAMLGWCLPRLDALDSHQALVHSWVRRPRRHQPVYPPLNRAETALRWGFPDAAAVLASRGDR